MTSYAGLVALLDSDESEPVNLGNPEEVTIRTLAEAVLELTDSDSELVAEPLPIDDPKVRCPDIGRAREVLGWEPTVTLRDGLVPTIEWFREELGGTDSRD